MACREVGPAEVPALRSRSAKILGGVAIIALIVAIGVLDVGTGSSYHFSIFYVVPTAAAGLYLGRPFGVAAGVVAGVNWDIADSVIRADDLSASLWNGLTRIAVLATLGYLTGLLRIVLSSLRRSQQELRDMLTQREEFLSLMAHELRAPVSAIEAVATGLASATTLSERDGRLLQRLVGQARDLSTLAEGVLAVGRIDAGITQLELETFDLSELAAEVVEGRPRARLRAPPGAAVVTADRNAMRRAIENVVQNALKFSPDDLPVDVIVREADGGTYLDVVDRGIGLSPDERAALFRRYSRVRRPGSGASVDGVGLGLYFARLIVEAHGGTVAAESAGHGRGSTFSIWLPAAERAPQRRVAGSSA